MKVKWPEGGKRESRDRGKLFLCLFGCASGLHGAFDKLTGLFSGSETLGFSLRFFKTKSLRHIIQNKEN